MTEIIDYSPYILKTAEQYKKNGMYNRYGILKDAAQTFTDLKNEHDALNQVMLCDHLARYATENESGTQYCVLCLLESLQEHHKLQHHTWESEHE